MWDFTPRRDFFYFCRFVVGLGILQRNIPPVSLENIKLVKNLSDQYGIPVIFDAARFAENAYFIKQREENYKDWSIKEICKEMFSYGIGMTMSSKKDGLVNIGGFIALNDEEIFRKASNFTTIT